MSNHLRGWLLVALALCLALAGCAREPDEAALREAVSSLETAIEQRDASAVEDALTPDFIGPDGLDRDGARRLAALVFLRHREVAVRPGPLTVEMGDGHARVDFSAVVTGGAGRALPEAARIYGVRTAWRVEDGEWRLVSAEWSPGV